MHFLASSGARRRVQCCAGGFAMMLAVAVHVLSPSGAAARDGAAAVALSAGSPIAAGFGHTCAVTAAGGAKCWGWNGGHGQIGDGTSTTRLVPVDVKHLTRGVAAIAADEDHTCAVTAAGGAKCWGWNQFGQIGDGTTTVRRAPVDVVGLTSGVAAIAAGAAHTCALTAAGGVKCWGWNPFGQIGDGTTTDRLTPVKVKGF